MKRLALVLAAALGAGCGTTSSPPPPPGSVDFAWSFTRYKVDGSTVSYGCGTAGVDNVVVAFAGAGGMSVPCQDNVGDGARFDNVAPGTQTVVLTGRRGTVPLFSAQVQVTVASSHVTPVNVALDGIPDDLEVRGRLVGRYGTPEYLSCNDAAVAGFSYVIQDSAGTTVASSGSQLGCSTGLPDVLFSGATQLDRDTYTIRMMAYPPASGTEDFDTATTASVSVGSCSGQAFDHFGPDTGDAGSWYPVMYDVSLNSTFCP